METEKKKYNQMENVLNKINQKYISLPEYDTKRNNIILEQVTDRLVLLMTKKDALFKQMYERNFYGGSYYDKIKVGTPEEYDLDFVLNLPTEVNPLVLCSNKPGYVQIRITPFNKPIHGKKTHGYEKLNTLTDLKHYLSTTKVLNWMERIMQLSLNELNKENGRYCLDVDLGNNQLIILYATLCKSYPAFTLKLRSGDDTISLDIDLVPCFQFREDKWPSGKYRRNPFPKVRNNFLIVPKKPHGMEDCNCKERYWRLSFQEQERNLITDHKFHTVKPAIRLIKKLRDKQNHMKIASYFIKTIFLWKVETADPELWTQSLSYVFMEMLKYYSDMIQNKNIPYYWNKNLNLLDHLNTTTLINIGNTLKNIIADIESNLKDPFTVAKYLIYQDQVDSLRSEVILGPKLRRKLNYSQSLPSSSSLPSVSTSRSSANESETEEDKIKGLVHSKALIQFNFQSINFFNFQK